ncbi:hypothetical protein [Marinomonas balearica]|uniref:Tetratricopeptide repeat protein n=1 Tax=Marinomonas balearica TaxID=491947 RepID=A0A4R6MA36_9GAMM|nr:hypothetical protein [Marinomonas balearica]TDO97915.1 hypothetical protein DFP79_1544 [Marinomonas balearica]
MKFVVLCLISVILSGCATYRNDIDEGLTLAHEGNWKAAESSMDEALNSSQDQLLFYLEKGALAQYQKDYERSNELLEEAEKISDTFFSTSYSNRAWALLTNPRQSDYRGNGLERVYISYLKSLNYLALSEQATSSSKKQQLMDASLVEARRIDLKLNEIAAQSISYEDLDAKEDQAFYMKAIEWLGNFYQGGRSSDQYEYREDAWARYLEGIQYEKSKEYDDARISYESAAKLYEAGYAKQYDLTPDAATRAWLDAIRMMQKGGWSRSEVTEAIDAHLTPPYKTLLEEYKKHDAEIVVLEHQGFVPAKKEMSLMLFADPAAYSLVLEPLHGGGRIEENDAFRWFTMVYSDATPLGLIANYKAGGAWRAVDGLFNKRVILGRPVWSQLSATGLDGMLMEQPLRITVPYYSRFSLDQSKTGVSAGTFTDDHSLTMTSLADIYLQNQLKTAQRDIYESLIREMIRGWLAYQVQSNIDDQGASMLIGLVSKVAVFISSAADTRNWLTLPAQVRLTRMPIDSGNYSLSYNVGDTTFDMPETSITTDDLVIWNIRNPN